MPKIKIKVDANKCIGCGACVSTCPKAFKLQDGKAVPVKESVDKVTCEKEAESMCPVGAISVK
jgi:ferredoxin